MAFRVDYAQSMPSVDRRDDGTLRVAANLTRTGVLTYTNPDGSPRREYRPPSEVFHEDSLASYGGRTIMIGHRLDAVTANAWSDVAKGDVRDDARAEGQFVRATLQVNDAKTVSRILDRELIEVSCGYRCDVDNTPGVSPEGEQYDAVQRNIRLNHVALLPKNSGRAGREVRLLLDSNGDVAYAPKIPDMADTNEAQSQKERADALEAAAKAKAEADALKGELAANKAALDKLRNDQADAEKRRGAEVAARVGLLEVAKRYLPELRADTSDSDDAIKRKVIEKVNPTLKCDSDASSAYVDGVFRACVTSATQDGGRKAVEAAIKNAPKQAEEAARADQGEDVIGAARSRCHEFGRTAWTMSEKKIAKLAAKADARYSR